ncbi:Ig-like domain-containing protein [Spongiactinospora sp. 9N601]|uniref:Ig-like domain-containing protein n=1 Tax=Spongiactinospora sp. 9N601 TaxID=3375149 RepID=UPI0037B9685D
MPAILRSARRAMPALAMIAIAVTATAHPALAVDGQSPPPKAEPGQTVSVRLDGFRDIGGQVVFTAPSQTTFARVTCNLGNGDANATLSADRRTATCTAGFYFAALKATQYARVTVDTDAAPGLKTGRVRHSYQGDVVDQGNFSIEVEPGVPPAPVITRPPSGSLRGTAPEIEGTGQDGATVIVRDAGGDPVCVTEVADGQWSCTPTPPFTNGEITLTATQVDDNGSSEASAPVTFTVNSLIDL